MAISAEQFLAKLHYGSPKAADHRRLRELMLYIAQRCADAPKFGAIKLNKILFWSDFTAFTRTGDSITGEAYHKQPFGPVPRSLKKVREGMEEKGDIQVIP